VSGPQRIGLPNRRETQTETLAIGSEVHAAVGFAEDGAPKELFLSGGKEGSDISALLSDAAVIISVALQHGVPASALAHSISRLPAWPDAPSRVLCGSAPVSVIGAALDLLVAYETEESR